MSSMDVAHRGARVGALSIVLALAAQSSAQAHQVAAEATGFLTGFNHPLSGLDHVIAMVAVGIWGAQLGAPAMWILPLAFPLVMSFGGFLGLIGAPLPGSEIGIALSGVILGAAVLMEVRAPAWVAALPVAVFGLFHGYAHGRELPPGHDALLYSLGFVVATGLLHATGITIGLIHRWAWGQYVLRALGACIAAGGSYFLWGALS